MTTIKPGVYPGKKDTIYRAWEAANKSTIFHCLRSPAHCMTSMIKPNEPTAAMQFGTAFHTISLEFQKFDRGYVKAPELDRRTKVGKQAWSDFQDLHEGKTLLSASDYDDLLAMRGSLLDHPIASKLLKARGKAELSYVWESRYAGSKGVLCKARADRVTTYEGDPVIIDLKSCVDASPPEFVRSVAKYGYDMQASFYSEGLTVLDPKDRPYRFIFVAVEKTAPFAVSVCELDEDSMEEGRAKAERAMALYAEATKTRKWAGYSPQIHTIATPMWSRTESRDPDFF